MEDPPLSNLKLCKDPMLRHKRLLNILRHYRQEDKELANIWKEEYIHNNVLRLAMNVDSHQLNQSDNGSQNIQVVKSNLNTKITPKS